MKTQKQIQSFSAKDANFIIKEIRYKKKIIKKNIYIYHDLQELFGCIGSLANCDL